MIISRMDGGLGNQMFQYAYGLYLARQHSCPLVLDTGSYQSAPQHGFLLDRFCIDAALADASHQALIPPRYRDECTSSGRTFDFLSHLPLASRYSSYLHRHKESPFGFRPEHLRISDNRYLVGYWQSEKFFPELRTELLKHFTLRDPLSSESQRVAERIRNSNSAVLHVRRGDYLTDPQASSIYARLDESYYRGSLHNWAATRTDVEVFIFSNDMTWCRANIDLPWKTHWVDHNTSDTGHEDLTLMSQAACCVIANSTFSWWAAWLNDRPDKVVYAPPQWFTPGTMDGSHIVPETWKQASKMVHQVA